MEDELVKLIGGPRDGEEMNIPSDKNQIVLQVKQSFSTIYNQVPPPLSLYYRSLEKRNEFVFSHVLR